MQFSVTFTPSADRDLDAYRKSVQQHILHGVAVFLSLDAEVENARRKMLRPNPLAPWELRLGDYRVFYQILPGSRVRVLAVGHKVHNALFIRGEKVEI